jgi:hypothetical protein
MSQLDVTKNTAPRALYNLLFSSGAHRLGPHQCSSGADCRSAFDYTDKLLKTLLIIGSLEWNTAAEPRPFCICTKCIAGVLGDNLNPLRAVDRMKE